MIRVNFNQPTKFTQQGVTQEAMFALCDRIEFVVSKVLRMDTETVWLELYIQEETTCFMEIEASEVCKVETMQL